MIFLLQAKRSSRETAELTDCYPFMAEMYISTQHSVFNLWQDYRQKPLLLHIKSYRRRGGHGRRWTKKEVDRRER
jgi:hypothetical protein